jgi:hypothetical protein
VWDLATGREKHVLGEAGSFLTSLTLTADGRTLFAKAMDLPGQGAKPLWFWDLTSKGPKREVVSGLAGQTVLGVAPDGGVLALAEDKKTALLLDATGKKERVRLEGKPEGDCRFAADGGRLLSWNSDGECLVWDLTTGRRTQQFTAFDLPGPKVVPGGKGANLACVAALTPDGKLAAFGSQYQELLIVELDTRKVLHSLRLPDGVSAVAISPDARTVAWGGWRDPTVRLIEVASAQERRQFKDRQHGRVLALTFSPDGRQLLSGSEDTTALIWDLTGGRAARETPVDLEAAWQDLASEDAVRAYAAVRRLTSVPRESAAYLRERVKPLAAPDERRVRRLMADLDSDDFPTREEATKELEKLGEAALGIYEATLAGRPSAEVRKRLEALREKFAELWNKPSPERLRVIRALEALEMCGTAEGRDVLAVLAKGAPGAYLTEQAKAALRRLPRQK